MSTIQLNDVQLEYMEKGRGDPLILVHGTLGDYCSWGLQMDAFAKKYRTIAYSRRYHFPNKYRGNETDDSATLHADDLAALITGLGMDSAHVTGTSYGAYTALLLARRNPKKIKSLVLSDKSLKMFQLIVDELHQCMPNRESKKVPDTTHKVPSNNPKAFNQLVLEFLNRLS